MFQLQAGVNGGYGTSAWPDQLHDFSNAAPNFFNGLSPHGWFGGGQAGFNWQGAGGPFVLGVEADIQDSGIGETAHWTAPDAATSTSKVSWFGTVRGRVGYAIDHTMIYVTGGWADGHVNNRAIFPLAQYIQDHTHNGYTLGGGVEFNAIGAPWSVKAEYQYINLGKNDPLNATTGLLYSSFPGVTVRDDAFHTFRLGLNYKFGSW